MTPDTPEPVAGRWESILAFDFGLRRIGVAVGQGVTGSASPLGIVGNGEAGPDFARIDFLVAEWRPSRLVVGMPHNADGSTSEMSSVVAGFVAELGRYHLPVDTVDERHTSQEAEAVLRDARASGRRGRIRKEHVDSAAAVLIAERYLAGIR